MRCHICDDAVELKNRAACDNCSQIVCNWCVVTPLNSIKSTCYECVETDDEAGNESDDNSDASEKEMDIDEARPVTTVNMDIDTEPF